MLMNVAIRDNQPQIIERLFAGRLTMSDIITLGPYFESGFLVRPYGDTLFGAVCGYLLLGIIWSLLYLAVETTSQGSFSVPAQAAADTANVQPSRGDLSYYSFITLTTVGYGDITPTKPLVRTLAWMEAVAGQFYLAVLVAGLVGYKVAQAARDRITIE